MLVGLLALLLIAVAGGVIALLRHDRTSVQSATGGGSCASGLSLSVIAAPAIAPALTNLADEWTANKPVVDGVCPSVQVHATKSADAEATLSKSGVAVPDLWIPDSSLWLQRLRQDTDGLDTPARSIWNYPSIASTPLVLAGSAAAAPALKASAAKGWSGVLTGTTGGAGAQPTAAVTDPTASTEGLLTLLTAQSALDGDGSAPSRQLVSTLVGLSQSTLSGSDAGFLAIDQQAAKAKPFPATEQQVVLANSSTSSSKSDTAKVVAVYPAGKTLFLDFPVAQFSPPGGDPARRDVARAFVAELTSAAAHTQFTAAGLRDRAGDPLPETQATVGASPQVLTRLATPSNDRVSDSLRVWSAAERANRTLVVIDLSGSMSEVAGGQTKIAFAAAAEKAAVDFFPDSSSLGLWGFSVDRSPGQDWQQFVPLGPLGSQVGTTTRRQALIQASAQLPNLTGGDTGLYNTALAAYESVRASYDPAAVNSVVLLTDGSNTATTGVDLNTLLSRLRSETSTTRPLPVITIAIGANADVATCKQISQATNATSYVVAQPGDIRGVFLDAITKSG
ncbi:substrate-binding domain-containing protein [Jatrophihabitans sp. DSM 45814]